MTPMQPAPDEFEGFDEARRLLWCHETRTRVLTQLEQTSFLEADSLVSVHVDNTTRADRVFLTAFNADGRQVGCDTLYIDTPDQRMDIAPEFDHDFTQMTVATNSELEDLIAKETGWVIDLTELRAYDVVADRHATQRKMFLAHLGDMMNSGQAKGFLFGQSETGNSDAA